MTVLSSLLTVKTVRKTAKRGSILSEMSILSVFNKTPETHYFGVPLNLTKTPKKRQKLSEPDAYVVITENSDYFDTFFTTLTILRFIETMTPPKAESGKNTEIINIS